MKKIDKNKAGLALGILFALIHAVWAVAVLISRTGMQSFLNWVMSLHFLSMTIIVEPFNFVNAILLVIITFVFGYVFGWIFAGILNWIYKK